MSSVLRYNLVRGAELSTITVYHEGQMYTADEKHPAFNSIVAKCVSNDVTAIELFDVNKAIGREFKQLSYRISANNGHLYWCGDEIHDVIVDHVFRLMEAGEKFEPLVSFLEQLYANPNEHSIKHLYRWLRSCGGFTINAYGHIIGYKGVNKVKPSLMKGPLEDGFFESTHGGYAIVNGKENLTGYVRQKVGDTVEMPRSKVQFDPTKGCSTGLHIGTYEYAKGYGNTVLNVDVNPRDVVSVPSEASDQKMRVCRYKILSVNTKGKNENPLDKLLGT